jgi:hypothetical protein
MKKVDVTIKNKNGETLPIGDIETFTILLAEVPVVGDYVVLGDRKNLSKKDQTSSLFAFCKKEISEAKSFFEFKAVKRTILRQDEGSWVNVELQYIEKP